MQPSLNSLPDILGILSYAESHPGSGGEEWWSNGVVETESRNIRSNSSKPITPFFRSSNTPNRGEIP